MTRRKAHTPLDVLINNRRVGRLEKEATGATWFQYDDSWLTWEYRFAVSLSLPLQKNAYRGAAVSAVFENLLPDNAAIRRRVAERTGAAGEDAYSLLAQIGRDCVGAMQFLPQDETADVSTAVRGEAVNDYDIENILNNLARVPLGIDPEHEFRISLAGAQEKTALLWHNDTWMRPMGATPTTHILKPQLGSIPTASGDVDMSDSVDNEHYCLKLLQAFGLTVAQTDIATFGSRRVLVVKRFDRQWDGARLLRLPQEDFCQALGVPPSRKYQATVEGHRNGPSSADIMALLRGSDAPDEDRRNFFMAQIIFWLMGATDGHAKNFSVFLKPGGGFRLTPFYDVLSAQPAFDKNQIPRSKYKVAMSVGGHYRIDEIFMRHFERNAKEAGLGPTPFKQAMQAVLDTIDTAADQALAQMPDDFAMGIHDSIAAAIKKRGAILRAHFFK